ncbi:MAG: tRNA epoxyqueuosine(34) reductase QueG [Planctomycetota bacterium]|nr:tRNA epoxyqueuosine(34) reductase QueG [Planctomycetota bacterium]
MNDALDVLKRAAAKLGFEVVGVTSARPVEAALAALETWSEAGNAAALGYMTRNPPERADPRTLLDGVRTVVTVAVNYHVDVPAFEHEARFGRVARYAWGLDYHDVVIPRLRQLADELAATFGGKARAACDHSPILERAFAERAGLGFFGKNTCLLLPRKGSWYFLGEVLLEAELPTTDRESTDHCGTCTDCMPACPTDAFPAPYVLDARRCISYLTIEHKGSIPHDLRPLMGAWVFGCDDCQDVCPFNRFASEATWPELHPDRGVGQRLDLADVLAIETDDAFRARFRNTPLLRPKRRGLLRNAAIAARNVEATAAIPALRARLSDPEPLLREAALWALEGLTPDEVRNHADMLRSDEDGAVVAEAARILGGGAA